jgi:mono/diheme cytochrome c family protein
MPAIPGLRDDDDARALVAYVRVLTPGYQLYTRFCASCHGDDGHADELVDPGRAPRLVFDRAYFARRDPEVLRSKIWHMLAERRPAMPHFRRRLSDEEARAIAAHLKQLR